MSSEQCAVSIGRTTRPRRWEATRSLLHSFLCVTVFWGVGASCWKDALKFGKGGAARQALGARTWRSVQALFAALPPRVDRRRELFPKKKQFPIKPLFPISEAHSSCGRISITDSVQYPAHCLAVPLPFTNTELVQHRHWHCWYWYWFDRHSPLGVKLTTGWCINHQVSSTKCQVLSVYWSFLNTTRFNPLVTVPGCWFRLYTRLRYP